MSPTVHLADKTVHQGGGETHQVAGGERPVLTTQQGIPVSDDQNTLRVGTRGLAALEDFQAAPLGSWRKGWAAAGFFGSGKAVLIAFPLLRARLPFLLTVILPRPNLALTARTRLLISAAKEGKDASPSMISEKSPEKQPPPRRRGALAAVPLILGGTFLREAVRLGYHDFSWRVRNQDFRQLKR